MTGINYPWYQITKEKAPVIFRMKTVLQDTGFFSKARRKILHQLSGVSESTFSGWFEGKTRSPRSETIYATMAAVGYKEEFVQVRTVDEEKDLIKAREFLERQRELRAKARGAPKKANGRKR